MTCPACGTHNPPEARFCRHCGAALPRAVEVAVDRITPDRPATSLPSDSLGTRPIGDPSDTRPFGQARAAQPAETPVLEWDATQPLPRPRFFFEALPIGALVGGLPYEILAVISESATTNIYSAQDRHSRIRCRSCAYDRNVFGDEFCQQCGAPLAGIEPHHPRYLAKESMAADAIAVERRLADMQLHHGGVLLPVDTFSETIHGTRRYYVVLPEPSPLLGTSLSAPQELLDVLQWGVMLSESLAFLHQRNIAFGAADLAHISLENKMARWFNFASAHLVTPGVEGRALFREDVGSLSAALFVLLTGQMYSPHVTLQPPSLMHTFADVFSGKLTQAAALADQLRSALAEVRRPASYDVRVGRLSDVGHMRQLNEDSLLTLEAGLVHRSVSRPIGVYVVADGAGGHAAGDVASGIVVRAIARQAVESLFTQQFGEIPPHLDLAAWLRNAIQTSNLAVHQQRAATRTDMGTTVVMAVVIDGEAHLAHVGDSRAYRIGESGLQQITVDHSLVQRLVDTGQITPEQARKHDSRNVIYKMIGDRPKIEPDLNRVSLQPGDRLLLCSDGLCGYVEDKEIYRIVVSSASPQEACQRLIDAANAAGGPDNITAILIQVEALGESGIATMERG